MHGFIYYISTCSACRYEGPINSAYTCTVNLMPINLGDTRIEDSIPYGVSHIVLLEAESGVKGQHTLMHCCNQSHTQLVIRLLYKQIKVLCLYKPIA